MFWSISKNKSHNENTHLDSKHYFEFHKNYGIYIKIAYSKESRTLFFYLWCARARNPLSRNPSARMFGKSLTAPLRLNTGVLHCLALASPMTWEIASVFAMSSPNTVFPALWFTWIWKSNSKASPIWSILKFLSHTQGLSWIRTSSWWKVTLSLVWGPCHD